MPMSLHLHHASDLKNYVTIMYGPIVSAGEFGHDDMPVTQEARDQNQFNRVANVTVPFLATGDENAQDWLKPVPNKPLTSKRSASAVPWKRR